MGTDPIGEARGSSVDTLGPESVAGAGARFQAGQLLGVPSMSEVPVFVLAMPTVAVALLLFWTTVGKRLVFSSYTKVQDRVAVGIVTTAFEFRLSLQLPIAIPAFEIVLRRAAPTA